MKVACLHLGNYLELELARAVLVDQGLVVGFERLHIGNLLFLCVQVKFAGEEKGLKIRFEEKSKKLLKSVYTKYYFKFRS